MWMNGPYAEVWEGEMAKIRGRFNKYGNRAVVHRETCPICGAKLVNLYRRENEWRCRRCWEKHDADPDHAIKLGPGILWREEKDGTRTIIGFVHKEEP